MGSLPGWRKAYGALKDTTKLGLLNVNGDFKHANVAIIKATSHVERPPNDRHLRKILAATSAIQPRSNVSYCIHALAHRLVKTHNWTVALKTLIVIHRIFRDGDPTFREEFLNFSQKGRVLQLSNFKDDSSPIAWDCSAWVRTYALFLEERLECYRVLKYDIEIEHLTKPVLRDDKGYSRTRDLESEELLEQLPALQQLLYRLIECRPVGAALGNNVIQYALALVLKESFKIYCAINDGIINLVDKFFEMQRHEAVKAHEMYKRARKQARSLSDFYELCGGLELARNFQLPVLREPPQSFLTTMEEYIREAPHIVSVSREYLELPEKLLLTYRPEEATSSEEETSMEEPKPVPSVNKGSHALSPDAINSEESNTISLAIVPSNAAAFNHCGAMQAKVYDPSEWELALVAIPSDKKSDTTESQLAGGLNSLTLHSLREEAASRQRPAIYGAAPSNPFDTQDSFAPSNMVAPPAPVQMVVEAQQQQPFAQSKMMQSNPFTDNTLTTGPSNPFGDTSDFGFFTMNPPPPPHHQNNPFLSADLI